MIAPGLLPAHHAVRLREHRAISAWAVAVAAATIAAAGLTTLFLAAIPEDDCDADTRIAEAGIQIAAHDKAASEWRAKAQVAARAIEAHKTVGEHPDWGSLMDRLADRMGPEVAVEEFAVTVSYPPDPSKPDKPTVTQHDAKADPADKGPRRRRWTITLAGLSPRQTAVAELVTGLELWGIFDRVRLIESKSRAVRSVDSAAFKIEALIEEGTR
jgi:hypothetical protein